MEFAEKAWPGYEVLVATHCDAAHIHSHFVINSVSFETGLNLRQHPDTLLHLRKLSDELCASHGLSALKPYEKGGTKISAGALLAIRDEEIRKEEAALQEELAEEQNHIWQLSM